MIAFLLLEHDAFLTGQTLLLDWGAVIGRREPEGLRSGQATGADVDIPPDRIY